MLITIISAVMIVERDMSNLLLNVQRISKREVVSWDWFRRISKTYGKENLLNWISLNRILREKLKYRKCKLSLKKVRMYPMPKLPINNWKNSRWKKIEILVYLYSRVYYYFFKNTYCCWNLYFSSQSFHYHFWICRCIYHRWLCFTKRRLLLSWVEFLNL